MNTLYVPCLSNYFMKFLLIKKKKLSVVKKETFSHEERKVCACPVYACAPVCVSISQRTVLAVFRQNDFFLCM